MIGVAEPPEADAPRRDSGPKRTPSELISSIMEDAITMARSTEDPGESQVSRLGLNLQAIAMLAEQGAKVATASGPVRGGGILVVVLAIVGSAAVAFGVPTLSTSDDAAQAKVLAQANAASLISTGSRISLIEKRQADEERRARRIQGLTVRWLGDSIEKQCKAEQEIATGINRLLATRKNQDPIEIDCSSATLPPELVRLEADLDIAESSP